MEFIKSLVLHSLRWDKKAARNRLRDSLVIRLNIESYCGQLMSVYPNPSSWVVYHADLSGCARCLGRISRRLQ